MVASEELLTAQNLGCNLAPLSALRLVRKRAEGPDTNLRPFPVAEAAIA